MSTALDLITASMKLLGLIAPGEAPTDDEAQDALSTMNRLMDSWSNEQLMVHHITREEFTLVPGQQTYSMGTGANFNTARPIAIEDAYLKITSVTPAIELKMHVCNQDEWARIRVKGVQSNYPLYLYAEGTFPNDTINVYTVPTEANTLVLYSRKPLSQLTVLTTALSLPPGYERALIHNLAIDLAAEYGKEPSASVVGVAASSKADLKRTNHRARYLRVDSAVSARPGTFNWMTGETQ